MNASKYDPEQYEWLADRNDDRKMRKSRMAEESENKYGKRVKKSGKRSHRRRTLKDEFWPHP